MTARLLPYVYEFAEPAPVEDGESLYVGKATDIKRRLADHIREERSHALGRIRIELYPVYGAEDADDPLVDLLEQQLIAGHHPKGNIQHNGSHYDPVWDRQVQRAHRKALGVPQPVGDWLRVWVDLVRLRVRCAARVAAWFVAVDVALFAAYTAI